MSRIGLTQKCGDKRQTSGRCPNVHDGHIVDLTTGQVVLLLGRVQLGQQSVGGQVALEAPASQLNRLVEVQRVHGLLDL
jgi:hypothetical protein